MKRSWDYNSSTEPNFVHPAKTSSMKKMPPRIIIYAKDVENITGRSLRTCYTILQKIKQHYGKKPSDLVTIKEFSEFMSIPESLIRDFFH